MSAISTAFLLAQQDFKIKDFKTYQTSEDDFDLLFPNATEAADINFQETIEELSNVQSFINKGLDEKNVEIAKCSSTSQETYNFEADAKETAANLKEIMYNGTIDRAEKALEFFENNLDPANIDIVLEEYKNLTGGRSIQQDLTIKLLLHPFTTNKINKILDSLLNFENLNTKIDNKYWQGDSHNVTREGSVFTITNTETNETREIDLAVLLKNFDTSKERKNFVEQLQKLPAEVLMDIAAEQTTLIELEGTTELDMGNGATCNAAGYYSPSTDQVAIYDNSSIDTIVHETGHALDYNRLSGKNKSSAHDSKNFTEIFNEELEKYLADGNKIYDYNENTKRETYATVNKREMFAECYTLLMTGDCGSKTIIEKYFPRMLSYVKQYIEYNRSHSDSVRH